MTDYVYARVRKEAEASAGNRQELNKGWWERLPMTYAPWESKSDRTAIEGLEGFRAMEREFLGSNPWLPETFDFNRFAGKRVLEIGCGAGAATCLFARGGAKITSVDLTERAVELTKKNLATQGLTGEVLQMDAEKLTFGPETFDYVFSWGVLHHSNDTQRAFGEVARVLRRGGSGLIMVYNKNSIRYYLRGSYWLLAKRKLLEGYNLESVQSIYTDGYFHRHFTPESLAGALEQAGLLPRKQSVTHMSFPIIPRFRLPTPVDQYLKKTVGWLLVSEFDRA